MESKPGAYLSTYWAGLVGKEVILTFRDQPMDSQGWRVIVRGTLIGTTGALAILVEDDGMVEGVMLDALRSWVEIIG